MNKWISRCILLNVCIFLLLGSFIFQGVYFFNADKKILNKPETLVNRVQVKDDQTPQSHIAESIIMSEEDLTYQYYNMGRLPQNVTSELYILVEKKIIPGELVEYLINGELNVEVEEGNYGYRYEIYGEQVGRINITTEKTTGKITFLVIVSDESITYDKEVSYYDVGEEAAQLQRIIESFKTMGNVQKEYIGYLGLDTIDDWIAKEECYESPQLMLRVGQISAEDVYILYAEGVDESIEDEVEIYSAYDGGVELYSQDEFGE